VCVDIRSYFLRFLRFKETRMSLPLGDADQWEETKDSPVLNFKFTGEIVDLNL